MLLALDPVNSRVFALLTPTSTPWVKFRFFNNNTLFVVSVVVDPLAVVVRCTVFVWKNRDIYDPTAFCDYEKQTLT